MRPTTRALLCALACVMCSGLAPAIAAPDDPVQLAQAAGDRAALEQAIRDPHWHYTGEIVLTTASACPVNTLEADGRELPIREYDHLYALMIEQFGSKPHLTARSFHLPDLRNTAVLKGSRYCIVVHGVYPR